MCDPMWHVSSRSGVATLRTAIHLLLTYLLYASILAGMWLKPVALVKNVREILSSEASFDIKYDSIVTSINAIFDAVNLQLKFRYWLF